MRKSYDRRKALLLTFLCCAVYFASYLTRTSFAAMMVEVIGAEGLKKTQVSAVTTASFAFYGAGQLLSGYLGDRFRPQRLMFFGLAVSSVCNFLLPAAAPDIALMTAIWALNGLAQAFMWPPMVRLMRDNLTREEYERAVPFISTASALGTIVIYLACPVMISLSGWRFAMAAAGAAGAAVSLLWLGGAAKFSSGPATVKDTESLRNEEKAGAPFLPGVLMPVLLLTIAFQGMLRDGVSSWTPTYLSEAFSLQSTVSILTSVALPVFHVLISLTTYRMLRLSRGRTMWLLSLYFLADGALLSLCLTGSFPLTLFGLAMGNGVIHGTNALQTSYLPAYFPKKRASFYAGLLNAATYCGSALATWLFALLSESLGWHGTVGVWCGIALSGALLTALIRAAVRKKRTDISI